MNNSLEDNAVMMLGAVAVQDLTTRVGLNPTQQAAVQETIQKTAANVAATKFMTKGQALLIANKPNLPIKTQDRMNKGNLRFMDSVKYVRKVVTAGSGVTPLLTDDLDKVPGICNLSKGRLDEGEDMMLRRIELMFDRASGITTKTADFAPLTTSSDNALLNGELEVMVGGNSVCKVPINRVTHPDRKCVGSLANGFDLESPILITHDDDIQINIWFVGTLNSSTSVDVIECVLIGDGSKARK